MSSTKNFLVLVLYRAKATIQVFWAFLAKDPDQKIVSVFKIQIVCETKEVVFYKIYFFNLRLQKGAQASEKRGSKREAEQDRAELLRRGQNILQQKRTRRGFSQLATSKRTKKKTKKQKRRASAQRKLLWLAGYWPFHYVTFTSELQLRLQRQDLAKETRKF